MDRPDNDTNPGQRQPNDFGGLVNSQNFQMEIVQAQKPVLLVCTHFGPDVSDQLQPIAAAARRFGDQLKIRLVEEEFLDSVKKYFQVRGTPTFLMIVGGIERGRLLGIADTDSLNDFVSQHLL
jgi:hypothetical protein